MAAMNYYDIILRPVVTEKSMGMMGDKRYAFYVNPDATKPQIADAVEKMFEGRHGCRLYRQEKEGLCHSDGRQQGHRGILRTLIREAGMNRTGYADPVRRHTIHDPSASR